MAVNPFPFQGLNDGEVLASRAHHGSNALRKAANNGFWQALKTALAEPMLLLLFAAAGIYFILGEWAEAWFMTGAIVLVSAISLYQDHRSRRALEVLQEFAASKAKAIRNGVLAEVHADELVVGDHVVVSEGELVPADGRVRHANDFAVNESILTGEAFPVQKSAEGDQLFRGTQAVDGLAVFEITAVGHATELGKIGDSLAAIEDQRSPLEKQIQRFVRAMAFIGGAFFLLVWALNFTNGHNLLDSLLKGLTLAMSILPEEIPVAFTTFMALGAWRMMQLGILVKRSRTVETLGAATVICTDKTGTITQNRMELAFVQLPGTGGPLGAEEWGRPDAAHLLEVAMWASEPVPFNPMEVALHGAYAKHGTADRRGAYHMVHEYPLGGRPPMMTHIFSDGQGNRIVAAKGAPEAIVEVCGLDHGARQQVMSQVHAMAAKGLRLLAVAEAKDPLAPWPGQQQQIAFNYLGLVAFNDPPKANIREVLASFRDAGIRTVIITGDNAHTTLAVAKEVGFVPQGEVVDGQQMQQLDDSALNALVRNSNCFTRMFPEAKLRVVKALKEQGNVVAMTGDGVNDGPALKAADIGIAMGKRGSELAKEAADLVLLDDDLGRMVDAIAQGRRIYANLKKAIQYVISIHIPIILTVALPLVLGWAYPNIFTPVHVIFLELLMGPTCSIAYESEPREPGTMHRPPRRLEHTFLSWVELRTSLLQGLMITAGTLFSYQYALHLGGNEDMVRTAVFTTLIVANVALTLVNRSFEHSVASTLRYRNPVLRGILWATLLLLPALLYVPFLRDFFRLDSPGLSLLAISAAVGLASVLWYEAVKWRLRVKVAREGPAPAH